MAEAIAFDIASNIVTKLGVAAFREICSMYGLDDDLKKLQETLSIINAVLLDADRKKEKSNQIQNWIKRLNDVVYDADDLLDAFHTKNLQRDNGRTKMQEVREFFSSSNQLTFRYKLGCKIKKIRERLDEIAANMSMFNFVVTERVIDRARVDGGERETDSYVLESDVIGREKEKEEIIDMLMCLSIEENVSIMSIFGIGGLGKTTLTQLVYCDKRVVGHFESMIWVCVSEDFDKKSLVRRILKSITNKEVEDLEMDQLQKQLRENIGGKRYLLVLDDVWNEDYEKWAGVKKFLVGGGRGSKILVTTRSRTVSSVMGVEKPYILEGLTEEQSWNLFVAFLGHKEVHPNIKAIGEQIIGRCKGVPLAIRSLGSVMKSKAKESEWLAIQNSEVWSLCESENSIMPILKLSYDHLPIHLRQCFAFCSLFPKDHEIEKNLLVQLWMAQGYIQSSSGSPCLEEIGDQYFEDLLSRSFFQDVQRVDYSNEIFSCKMHDLIHDLALKVAGSHCRFIAQNDAAINISERLNHVSLEISSQDIPRQLLQARGLRTYISIEGFCALEQYAQYGANILLLSKFKRMRALDLRCCRFEKLPNWVSKMQHLRYLDLSENGGMKVIPNSITNLVNLQMLNLSKCFLLEELPEGIGKLISLRHLVIDGCDKICHMPRGLEKLTSLRTLSRFIVGGDERRSIGIEALKGLNNLVGRLSIEKLETVRDARLESKAANLMGKRNLKELILLWKDKDDDAEILLEGLQPHPNLKKLEIKGYSGARLSSWMMGNTGVSLPNIVRISLINCPNIKQLPPFYQLPCLKSLYLQNLPKVEYGGDGDGDGSSSSSSSSSLSPSFPCLSFLRITECPMLTSIPLAPLLETLFLDYVSEKLVCQQLSSSPLSRLNSLVKISFSNCPNIKQLPPFHQLPCLRHLHLKNLPKVEEYGCDGDGSSSSSSSSSFPCLTNLHIYKCPMLTSMPLAPLLEKLSLNYVSEKLVCQQLSSSSLSKLISLDIRNIKHLTALEHLNIDGDGSSSSSSSSFPSFPSLTSLEIHYCPMLTSMPLAPLLERLTLKYVSEKIVCQQLSSSPLSRLSYLNISNIKDIEALPLRNLTSLKTLYISSCRRLLRLAEIQHLTSLEYLNIFNCEEVDLSDDGMNWQALSSLRDLLIQKLPKLVSLPEGLQHVTTLQRIDIIDCPGLVALPEWMSNLTSLEDLCIDGGPLLSKRCKKDTGEDWPNIAHIPKIWINYKWIQERY